MGIVNRRNAVLGWAVWKITKDFGRRKARAAVPGTGDYAGLNKGAIASIAAAVGGALWFWRKKAGDTPSTGS
jgi:ABC-type Co2+ transport system permease subunit